VLIKNIFQALGWDWLLDDSWPAKGGRFRWLTCLKKTSRTAAEEFGGIFTGRDVTKCDDQAAAFQKTWEVFGRLDLGTKVSQLSPFSTDDFLLVFVYANAGIVELHPGMPRNLNYPLRSHLYSAQTSVSLECTVRHIWQCTT
jgi:hypothetical protein